jgi:hypothetical protein
MRVSAPRRIDVGREASLSTTPSSIVMCSNIRGDLTGTSIGKELIYQEA